MTGTAKLLGLGYPGGPQVEKEALRGNAERFALPRPMFVRNDADFSFSGLKTALRLEAEKIAPLTDQDVADLCASFQQAVVETLTIKCKRALKQAGLKRLVIAGGVSANKALRASLEDMLGSIKGNVYYARPQFCTDNGAMIAYAGCQRLLAGQRQDLAISVQARWPMEQLSAL